MKSYRRKLHKRRKGPEKLQITALLDIMTILLFFLLKSYSATESLNISKNLQLPRSQTGKPAINALNIAISTEEISVDGELVVTLEEGKSPGFKVIPTAVMDTQGEPEIIVPLLEILKRKRGYSMNLSRGDDRLKFSGDCIVQADSDAPYKLLHKVLYTAGQVGYVMLNFAVISEDQF